MLIEMMFLAMRGMITMELYKKFERSSTSCYFWEVLTGRDKCGTRACGYKSGFRVQSFI